MTGPRRDTPPARPASGPGRRRPLTAPEWETTNRLGLLLLHALIGLVAGLLILFNGTAAPFDRYGDWVRLATGGLSFVGGAVLAVGLARRATSMVLEVVGLALLALWALLMGGGLLLISLSQGVLVIDWPWDSFSSLPTQRLYPIAILMGLFLMTALHLWTATRVRRLGLAARHRAAATTQQRVGSPRDVSSMARHPSLEAWRVGGPSTETLPPSAQP